MVDMIFYIEDKPKDIFGVGFRPAIMGSAAERYLKSAAINIPDENPRVEVLVNGSHNIISSFHDRIKTHDIRIKPTERNPKKIGYTVTDIKEYNGPNIDWNGYQLSLMTEQMSKGFAEANQLLTNMNKQISKMTKSPPRIKSARKGKKSRP
jgi:acylphosphatase